MEGHRLEHQRLHRPSLRCGNMCAAPGCSEEHVRKHSCAKVTNRPATGSDARCVKNAVARLHRAPRFVTSVTRKTTRNALGDRGPVVSLKRRDGSKPLRRRPPGPDAVCTARTPVGLQWELPPSHPTHLRCPRGQARACHAVSCANGDRDSPGVVGPSVYRTGIRNQAIDITEYRVDRYTADIQPIYGPVAVATVVYAARISVGRHRRRRKPCCYLREVWRVYGRKPTPGEAGP